MEKNEVPMTKHSLKGFFFLLSFSREEGCSTTISFKSLACLSSFLRCGISRIKTRLHTLTFVHYGFFNYMDKSLGKSLAFSVERSRNMVVLRKDCQPRRGFKACHGCIPRCVCSHVSCHRKAPVTACVASAPFLRSAQWIPKVLCIPSPSQA